MHEGHRGRNIERLMETDNKFQDWELLEVLLYSAIPRKDTHFIARELMSSFGTLSGILNADMEHLMQVEGIGQNTAAFIRCISLIYSRIQNSDTELPVAFSPESAGSFIARRFEGLKNEVLECYSIDETERITFVKRFNCNDPNKVYVSPEEITKFLTMQKPYAFAVAHNHIEGSPEPSDQDDEFTAQVLTLCRLNNIKLYDHIIVGRGEYYSYHLSGRLYAVHSKREREYGAVAV